MGRGSGQTLAGAQYEHEHQKLWQQAQADAELRTAGAAAIWIGAYDLFHEGTWKQGRWWKAPSTPC